MISFPTLSVHEQDRIEDDEMINIIPTLPHSARSRLLLGINLNAN